MKDLNRLKIVLCENKKTSKWLASELEKNPTTISKSGVQIQFSRICLHSIA